MAIYLGYDRVGIVKYIKVPVRANIVTLTGTYTFTLNNVVGKEVDELEIKGNSIQQTYTGKNLFNKETATKGVGLSISSGGTYNDANYFTSDFMPVEIGKSYAYNWQEKKWYCLYDENKNFLEYGSRTTYFTNTNASFVRFTCALNELDTFQLEQGTTPTEYEKYVGGEPSPNPDYPQEIESVGERTSNLFDSSIWEQGTIYVDNGEIALNRTLAVNPNYYEIESNCQYVIFCNDSYSLRHIYFYDKDKNYLGYIWTNRTNPYVFTSLENANYIRVVLEQKPYTGIILTEQDLTGFSLNSKVQINKGSTVADYEPYGYKVPIEIGGRNLVNIPDTKVSDSNITIGVDLAAGKTYTISSRIDSNGITGRIRCIYNLNNTDVYSVNSNWVSNGMSVESGFEIPQGATNIRILLQRSPDFDGTFSNIMVVEGTYTLENLPKYEAYAKTTKTIYLNEPLRKVGDYADYIDYKNKKVVRNVGKYVPTGNEDWALYNVTNVYQMYTHARLVNGNGNIGASSTITPFGATVYNRHDFELGAYLAGGGTQLCFQLIGWTTTMTADEWAEYLGKNTVNVYYVLATPTEETIDIPKITLKDGTNIVTIDTKVEPSETTITYWEEIIDG